MLRFKVFGIPVTVNWFFWLIAAIIANSFAQGAPSDYGINVGQATIVGVALVFLSILVHELGHALLYRHYGAYPAITFQGLGGLTTASGSFSRMKSIVITAAGPAFGFLLALAAFAVHLLVPGISGVGGYTLRVLIFINVFWSIMNLLPVYPLDGGQILGSILGPRRMRATAIIGLVVGGAIAVYGLINGQIWLGMLFGMLAVSNWQHLKVGPQLPF